MRSMLNRVVSFSLGLLLTAMAVCPQTYAQQTDAPPVPSDALVESRNSLAKLLERRDHIVGIELIIAQASSDQAYSRWGHTMLRFVDDSEQWNNQIVLSFLANVDENQIDPMKGIQGDYGILVSLTTFENTWIRYIQGEGRALDRFIIPTEKQHISRLMDTLRDWVTHPEQLGGYKFFSRNCASLMADFLKTAGLGNVNYDPIIPTRFSNWLARSWLSPFPKITVHNPFGVIDRAAKVLSLTKYDLYSGANWPSNAADLLLSNFDEKELKLLYRTLTSMPFRVSRKIASKVNYFSGSVSYDEVMDMASVPAVLYGICANTDEACFQAAIRAEKLVWNKEALDGTADSVRFWIRNTDIGYESQMPIYDKPFNLLIFPNAEEQKRKQTYLERLSEESPNDIRPTQP